VGKSSLINMLTNRKSLALVSKEPGETLAFVAGTTVQVSRQQLTALSLSGCHLLLQARHVV
jgi:tRNA U34 5-carboxymethylaminomethyl modifying GTPase MnmE/TrmE